MINDEGFDKETGELRGYIKEVTVRARRAADVREKEPHVRQFDATMMELARLPLTGNDRTVLTALLFLMTYDGPFLYSTAEIAAELNLQPSAVSRSLRNLKDNGVVLSMGTRRIMVHPRFFYKGDGLERQAWITQIEQGRADVTGE